MATEQKIKKPKSKEYPAYSLNDAISFVDKLGGYPVRQPIAYQTAAREHGIASVNTKSFKYRLSAAKQFGLLTTAGGSTLTLTDWAYELLLPTKSNEVTLDIRRKCFKNPKLYAELIELYEGKSLPTQFTLENLLVQSHGIVHTVKEIAAKNFIESANQAGAVTAAGVLNLKNSEVSDKLSTVGLNLNKNSDVEEVESLTLKPLCSYEEIKSDISMEELVIPLGKNREARFNYPSDISSTEAKFVENMITSTLKYKSGEVK